MFNQSVRDILINNDYKLYSKVATIVFLTVGSLIPLSISAAPPISEPLIVEVNNFPSVQDVEVTNLPAIQDVDVNNFPSVMDVNVVGNQRLQVKGSVTTGTDSGGGNYKTIFTFAYVLNDLSTNYGRVPAGKKLVITDIIARHGVNTSVGVSNLRIVSKGDGEVCGSGGSSRLEWELFVSEGESAATNLTTGIEIPEGRILCAASTSSISVSAILVGYITDL